MCETIVACDQIVNGEWTVFNFLRQARGEPARRWMIERRRSLAAIWLSVRCAAWSEDARHPGSAAWCIRRAAVRMSLLAANPVVPRCPSVPLPPQIPSWACHAEAALTKAEGVRAAGACSLGRGGLFPPRPYPARRSLPAKTNRNHGQHHERGTRKRDSSPDPRTSE